MRVWRHRDAANGPMPSANEHHSVAMNPDHLKAGPLG
jgi:hypothetical protein